MNRLIGGLCIAGQLLWLYVDSVVHGAATGEGAPSEEQLRCKKFKMVS